MTKQKANQSEFDRLWGKLGHIFAVIALFSFFINALMLAPSIYMLQIYDRVLASRSTTTLMMLTGLILGMYVLMSLLEWVRSRLLVRASARLEEEVNEKVFTSAFQAILLRSGGDPRQAIGDLTNVRQFLTGNGLTAFFDVPWAPIYLVFCFLLHPWLGWFTLAGMLTLLVVTVSMEWATRKLLEDSNAMSMKSNQFAHNQLMNAEVIQAMGMLPALRQRWRKMHNRMLSLQAMASDRASIIGAFTKFVRISMQSLILGLGAYLVIADGLSPGAMIAASILMGRALAPIEQMIGTWRSFISARGAYGRLNQLLNHFAVMPEAMPLPPPRGAVRVEAVFALPPGGSEEVILKGVNFSFAAGETVVIVGPSGSGKSTLARLLVGVWGAQKGVVRLDGVDVFRWNKAELGPWIGYLPQDVELFDGTIAENIARFGKMDSAKVIESAKRAGVHDLVLRLKQGYDSPIGPGGCQLSGGQRQRIALARALYGDPALVVLDEPNANLDEAGEAALLQAIGDLKKRGKSVVLISHRTNILNVADKLLILAHGQIQAYGPRDEVLQSMQAARQSRLQAVPKT